MPALSLKRLPRLNGFGIEWLEPGLVIASRFNAIFKGATLDGPFEAVGTVPTSIWRSAAARLRPMQRLLRFAVYNAVPLADGSLFVTFDRTVGVLRAGEFRSLEGPVRPCRVLRGGCAVGPDGGVYFGEYWTNRMREAVHVYRYFPGDARIERVYTFAAGSVRHIHGVYADPWQSRLWITTGDIGRECAVRFTDDEFRTVESLGEGDESWRCITMRLAEDAIYYATDAEFEQNWLYRVDRATGRREALAPVEGPVYYSAAAGRDMFFGVTAELCPSQQGTFAALWHIGPNDGCTRVATFSKDLYSAKFFLPGSLDFPAGPGLQDRVVFRCTALVDDDLVYVVRTE